MTTARGKHTKKDAIPASEVFASVRLNRPLTFGETLQTFRECEGWSQAETARRLGVPRQRINDYESGRRLPSARLAYQMASLFGMMPEQWVEAVLSEQLQRDDLPLSVQVSPRDSVKGTETRTRSSSK
jgi:transcriptional regulator with XRE-family HTH domain